MRPVQGWLFALTISFAYGLTIPPSPQSLAYIGDSVYETLIRTHFLTPPKSTTIYRKLVTSAVCAEFQAQILKTLKDSNFLTPLEEVVVVQGRNSVNSRKHTVPKRFSKNKEGGGFGAVYGDASGFEALVGYLHLTDEKRLQELQALVLNLL